MKKPLRDYQVAALEALNSFYAKGGRSGGISLPTGTGKTRVMTEQADRESRDWSDNRRVAVVVDRDVLVEQTEKTLREFLPSNVSIGVVKATRNELGAQVLVISIHTMRSARRLQQIPPIKLAIVDEAHMSVSPTYKRFFAHIGANEPGGARLAGYSATWTRSDSTGLGDVWQDVVFSRPISWAIEHGFLVPPRAIQVGEGVDLADVRTKGKNGDYREEDLGRAVMLEELRDNMVSAVLRHGHDALGRPRPGVLFAPTVESAEYFGQALRDAGVPTEGIYGELGRGERRDRHGRHGTGATRILTTCTALAVGWDFPPASLGILLRPIRHEGLFVQMAGRLLRTSPETGKTDALLLDMVRATDDLRLRNAIDLGRTIERDVDGELEEVLDPEPITRERVVIRRKGSYEVNIVSGSSTRWLEGPAGIPFVSLNEMAILFVIADRDGWKVCYHDGRASPVDGRPMGKFLTDGLPQKSLALDEAATLAERMAVRMSDKMRAKRPTEAMISRAARSWRVQGASEMTRGELDDAVALQRSAWALEYFAQWSAARCASALAGV